jgi:aspartate kinase
VPFPVQEIWVRRSVAKVTLKNVRDKPGIAAQIFEILAEKGINAELIVSGSPAKGRNDVSFLVLESQIPDVMEIQDELIETVGGTDLKVDRKVALIIFYGGKDFYKHPGIAAQVFNLFASSGVNLDMISTSFDSICVVIREERVENALEALEEHFGIEPKEGYGQ